MINLHWEILKNLVQGKHTGNIPVGFIIDCPWLPNWAGMKIIDYFTNEEKWFEAHLKAAQTFPDVIFIPGFWSEFGMCTEPSAFGAKTSFPENEFPHAFPNITDAAQIHDLPVPNPVKDGLGPFIQNRLKLMQPHIENAGHRIRFSVSRGPLNIASYLMGATEFMMAMITNPEEIHLLIRKITDYLAGFHDHQKHMFPSIDGILILDDIIGFISEDQFLEFGLPYFKELYNRDLNIKFLHNDANCMESVQHLPEMGVNLFNMGFDTDLNQLKELTNNQVTMLGNIPPRDVLARGTVEEVKRATLNLLQSTNNPARIIFSCGGGMPPGVSTEQIRTFIDAVQSYAP